MNNLSETSRQVQTVADFRTLLDTPFSGTINALCWKRELEGDFSEIVNQFHFAENMIEIELDELQELKLSVAGQIARMVLINDINVLKKYGASPTLNLIKKYERDETHSFFPTDVYSYHVDRSPIPSDTFLCTYHGDCSDIIANDQAVQKILIPEIYEQLKELYTEEHSELDFESFLKDNFFDLHYQALPSAVPIQLGNGNLWKIATDHPTRKVLPCLHRAPNEDSGLTRLLLIC